jgi:hypothetical protein
MKRTLIVCCGCALLAGLAACEKPQTAETRKSDTRAWQGAENPYVASGWTAGDQVSWEQQLRTRAQAQNDYAKAK